MDDSAHAENIALGARKLLFCFSWAFAFKIPRPVVISGHGWIGRDIGFGWDWSGGGTDGTGSIGTLIGTIGTTRCRACDGGSAAPMIASPRAPSWRNRCSAVNSAAYAWLARAAAAQELRASAGAAPTGAYIAVRNTTTICARSAFDGGGRAAQHQQLTTTTACRAAAARGARALAPRFIILALQRG